MTTHETIERKAWIEGWIESARRARREEIEMARIYRSLRDAAEDGPFREEMARSAARSVQMARNANHHLVRDLRLRRGL